MRQNKGIKPGNPTGIHIKLFTATTNGRLDILKLLSQRHILKEVPLPPMDSISSLEEPEIIFRAGGLWPYEAREFICKTHACSAAGFNGTSLKLYKNGQLSWNSSSVSYKEPGGKDTSQKNGIWLVGSGYLRRRILLEWAPFAHFRSVKVDGKIFFGVIARRMTPFLFQDKKNQHISPEGWHPKTSCLQHAQMIWNSLMTAKQKRRELHVAWLDVANARGPVSHSCIGVGTEFLPHSRECVWYIDAVIRVCLYAFHQQLHSGLQSVEVGIMMGHVVLPPLFVMCMRLILLGISDTATGEETRSEGLLPPLKAFMGDVTTIIQSKVGT